MLVINPNPKVVEPAVYQEIKIQDKDSDITF